MKKSVVISVALGMVFLLYFQVLGNGFLTDDYASLYRLLIQKRVLFEEMVRPLIDISFYFNYLISGLHPLGYYIFNFCVHALACFMVYQVALDLPLFSGRKQRTFALVAGFLFLFYPFHNEGVVWLSGRLSSMAALLGLLSIHFFLIKKRPAGLALSVLCWWTGLFAYESILVLPAVALLFEWIKFRDIRRTWISFLVWVPAGLVWLGMRYFVSGEFLPAYGQGGLAGDPIWVRVAKVIGRCFLPPEENSRNMLALFAGTVLVLGIVHVWVWIRLRDKSRTKAGGPGWELLALELAFLAALLPAVAFEVSTRTSEGDRLLYFPSCMLSMLAAGVVMTLVTRPIVKWFVLGAYALTGAFLIRGNNRHWVFASRTAEAGLALLRQSPGRVVLVNVPDEWEGAYIFRNSFNEGLTVNGIDSNRVKVTHVLKRLEYLRVNGPIEPERLQTPGPDGRSRVSYFIFPATRIDSPDDAQRTYYWDKNGWKKLFLD